MSGNPMQDDRPVSSDGRHGATLPAATTSTSGSAQAQQLTEHDEEHGAPNVDGTQQEKDWKPSKDPGSVDQLNYLLKRSGITPDLVDQWASSPERNWYLGRRHKVLYFVVLAAILVTMGVLLASTTITESSWWTFPRVIAAILCAVGLVALGWCVVPYWAARRAFLSRRKASARYLIDDALRGLRQAMEKTEGSPEARSREQLARMFELNRRQLDEYQQITKSQQRTAFALTWGAAIAAFLILVIGSVTALQIKDDPEGKYIATGLTALGSLLSAFLGKTFFDGHDRAMRQLNHYYHEPSLTGRLLTAERILEHLPDDVGKSKAATDILTKILSWEPPPMTEDSNVSKGGADPKVTPGPSSAP